MFASEKTCQRRGEAQHQENPTHGNCDGHVLGTIAVGVTDKRCLPVVVQFAVSHGDSSAAMGDVKKTVVAKRMKLVRYFNKSVTKLN